MVAFSSVISDWLYEFSRYREASGLFCQSSQSNLLYFDRHCSTFASSTLTQEMVDTWMAKRPTEVSRSCVARTRIARQFILWARKKGLTDVILPEAPSSPRSDFTPHSFTRNELRLFFEKCDNLPLRHKVLKHKLYAMVIPVMFRLLVSTGMRTCEARLLRRLDVDLVEGVVEINHSKGPGGHRVALSQSMLDILRRYDAAVDKLMPNREFMFPNHEGNPRSRSSLGAVFTRIWRSISEEKARAYDFRAHYATTNINSWNCEGMEWHWKLVILSKTMGHTHLQSTCHYYNITPYLYKHLDSMSSEGLNEVLPELTDFFPEDLLEQQP